MTKANYNNYKEKIAMKFNVNQLDRIIIALINNGFNKKFASNVKRLFALFSANTYTNDHEKEVRVYLIKEIVDIIAKNNIEDKNSILSLIDTDGKYYLDCTEILNNLFEEEIPESELELLDKNISNQLKYSAIMEKADDLNDKLLNLKAENFENLDSTIADLEASVDMMNKDIKSARESLEDAKKDMSLSSSSFINVLGDIIEKERNPATKVKTGIQALNQMLNGGMERSRLYCVLGMAKSWKSGFMLNCASWAKRYNTFTTENGRKPVIVYLNMENTNEETIQRLWNHCFGNESNIKNFDKTNAAREFEKAGLFTPNDPNAAELQIWYRSNRSINTADLNVMLEDLKKEGKECVLLIVDYLKRIRPTETNKDLRLELSNVTNELKSIAIEQNIPVLTGMQLNRDAFKAKEEAETFSEVCRAFNKLGASNVGESIDIIQNVDWAAAIDKNSRPQRNEDGDIEFVDNYFFMKLIACRMKQPRILSIRHRFADGNDMKLIEDINMPRMVSVVNEDDFIRDQVNNNQIKSNGKRSIA